MKRLLIFITLLSVFLGPTVLAVDVNSEICNRVQGTKPAYCNPQPTDNVASSTIARATRLVATITGIASVIMISIGGLRYALSGGDPGKVNSAKNTIIYSLVGLFVALSAWAIVIFVLNRT